MACIFLGVGGGGGRDKKKSKLHSKQTNKQKKRPETFLVKVSKKKTYKELIFINPLQMPAFFQLS